MKKAISLILSAILATTAVPLSANADISEREDVNVDGKVDVADLVVLSKWLLGENVKLSAKADLNDDNNIDVFDLCILRQRVVENNSNVKIVSDIEGIFTAMRNAQPGDIIKIATGTYDYTPYQGAQKIDTSAAGTADAPIKLTALDPDNPPILTGKSNENGYVLHIKGDYWILDNLICKTSQKGIVLDNSSHSIIRNCVVYDTGSEAIALRDGSSYCLVERCNIHDIGLITPGFGEGVYIGSAVSTSGFDYKCDYNKVVDCTFKNVAAEHVDVKEFTTGTEIYGCTFYGDGMSGANFAGSFIDIAGNEVYVHDNIGYRNQNKNIVAAFEIHEQVDGWGYDHIFENNTVYMDREYGEIDTSRRMYVVDGWFSNFTVKGNMVDYGNGLIETKPEYYNSDYVTFEK